MITQAEVNSLLNSFEIDSTKYKGILCPLRGGMYVADPLSRKHNIPLYYVKVSSYEGKKQKEIKVNFYEQLETGHYLIADDIYDTGNTIKYLKSFYSHCTFDVFCLISKQDTNEIQYGKLVDSDEWVDFYWESILNKENRFG